MDSTKNVFISHRGIDDEHIQKLKDLLSSKGYQIRNSSIDSSKPNEAKNDEYIKSLLHPRIQWASTTVVLISPDTKESEWVNWEIEQAHYEGKRIVGVYVNGANNCDVPEKFEEYGDALVGWTGDRIIDSIEGELNNFENPDGTPRVPKDIARGNC
jgi:hypothetical protein